MWGVKFDFHEARRAIGQLRCTICASLNSDMTYVHYWAYPFAAIGVKEKAGPAAHFTFACIYSKHTGEHGDQSKFFLFTNVVSCSDDAGFNVKSHSALANPMLSWARAISFSATTHRVSSAYDSRDTSSVDSATQNNVLLKANLYPKNPERRHA